MLVQESAARRDCNLVIDKLATRVCHLRHSRSSSSISLRCQHAQTISSSVAMPYRSVRLQQFASLSWVFVLATLVANAQELQHFLGDESNPIPRLNFSSPSPLIFHSTFGLLQQWSNTFFPNGHTIAPCTIAKNTNLYHARGDSSFPPSPEWFALDADMSYFIAGAMPDSHLLTYRTTKEVKCLYFDGTSASLMDDGSMDTQMLLIHNGSANIPDRPAFGPSPPQNGSHGPRLCAPGPGHRDENCTHWNPIQAEYDRADGLCGFIKQKKLGGPGWGYEGVVRMNAAFELIWCNFSSPSAKLVSWLNVSAPVLEGVESGRRPWEALISATGSNNDTEPYVPTLPPRKGMPYSGSGTRWPGADHPFQSYSVYEWFHVAAKRYGFSGSFPGRGEARVSINSCGLFTFYDPALHHQELARIEQEKVLYNLTRHGDWQGPRGRYERQAGLTKLTRRMRMQRPMNVSLDDGMYMRAAIEDRMRAALESTSVSCSGVDWPLLTQEIVTVYGGDIYHLAGMLSANVSLAQSSELRSEVARVREVAHGFWMPYYEYPYLSKDSLSISFSLSAPESQTALERCKTQYEPADLSQLSASEQTTHTAMSEVLAAICGTLLPIFLGLEQLWLANFNNASAPSPEHSSPVYMDVDSTWLHSRQAVEELMAWLGWADQWTGCSPGCAVGEVCYIPIWPVMGMGGFRGRPGNGTGYGYGDGRGGRGGYPPGRRGGMDEMEGFLWKPRCVDAEHYPPE